MGVSGLNTFMKKHGGLILRDYNLRSTRLIIDGHNVCHELFYAFQHKNSHFYGGDYDRFAQVCRDFFTALRHCDVTPYVIYDGAYDALKLPTMLSKASYRLQTADKISRGQYGMVLPVMSYETFRDVVDSMGVQHVTCNFDADHQAAALAMLAMWRCPILSKDTDFLIYNVPAGVILWDFMEVKKFVSEAISGENRDPTVKIYNIGAVLKEARSSDPHILALWATLLGNDRVNRELFSRFFRAVQLPATCGRIQSDGVQDRVLGVLGWLGSMSTQERALDVLLDLYSDEERPDVESAVRTSIAAYNYLTCEIEGHFFNPDKLTGKRSVMSYAGKQPPDWFMVGIRSGRIPVHALDALVLRKVILPTQVSVTSQPSPYQCSATLRRFLYSVLLRWDDEPGAPHLESSVIEEFDRDQNLRLKNECVHALVHLESGRRVPSLEEIPLMTEPERKSALMEVLGVAWSQMGRFDPRNHLLMATIVHWMRNSRPSVDQLHLESLLVCFYRAGILGNRVRGKDAFLEELRETPNDISSQTFDCAVVHSFAQFQCCLQMALYVNQILQLPAPNPLPVLAFNGIFLHNFYRKLVELRCQQQQQMQLDEEQEGWQQQKQRRQRRQNRQQPYEQPAQQKQTTPRQQQQMQQQQRQQQQRHGVISENPNPLETACADIAIYSDKLLSIV